MSANTHIQLPFTTSHAFIVGINDYQHLTPLSTAVNDARVIAERLAEQHGFKVHAPLLNATHQSLRKLLTEDIPRLVGKDDRVLFYFAGHGVALDGEEGPNGYLVAADTRPGQEETLIPMATLHDALTTLPCRHGLLILDCCFSGAFKWSSGFRDVIFDLPKVIYEERFWRYCKDPAWQVITSSAHDQKAVDIITNQSLGLREEGGGQHSPFAASLLEALGGAGDVIPAGKGDGVMTATELYSYLRDAVETQTTENAKRQSPSIFNLKRHDKGEFIFLHPNHRFNLPPTPDRNPFMGLSSYSEEDASLFFGRDRVVEVLLEKVKANSLTVVSGASGTGKSSVIKAGVLPQLRKAGRTILPIIRPGKEPMQTIATELPDIEKQLKNGAPILVIDQYEELITQCLNQEERLAFEQQIAQWLEQYPELDIILSIRADFEPQFESEALAPWWAKGRYVVPSFSLDEIREVITRPAAQAVLFYEPEDLVEQISEEVSQAPGALPLLSFTLSELYHAYLKSGREDRALAQEDYVKLGGVIGALRTRADAEYESLNPAEQTSMRKLMLRMVSAEGGELAGKRIFVEELQFSNTAETTRLRIIADQLVNARLLLKGTDRQGRTYIEPAHDALVRAWARLWEWIKTVGESKITLHYKLGQATNEYQGLLSTAPKKARNLLWNNNPSLDLLKVELLDKDHAFNKQEETFVRNSLKRRSARKRTAWGITIGVITGLSILSLFAYNNSVKAESSAQLAQENEQRANEQRDRAEQETLNANLRSLLAEARSKEDSDPLRALRLAEQGYQVANKNGLETQEFTKELIKLVYSPRRFELDPTSRFTPIKIKPSDRVKNHTLRINGQVVEEYGPNQALVNRYTNPGMFTGIEKAQFDPAGNFVIVEYGPEGGEVSGNCFALFQHGGAEIEDIYARLYIHYYKKNPFFANQTGDKIAIFDDDQAVQLLGIYRHNAAPEKLERISVYGAETAGVSLSPSGDFLAAASTNGNVKVFNLTGRREEVIIPIWEFTAHQNKPIPTLEFYNDEKVLKTTTEDGASKYWSLEKTFPYPGGEGYKFGVHENCQDVFTGASIRFKAVSDIYNVKIENEQYTLNNKALYSKNGETLVLLNLPHHDNDPFFGAFSEDNRYIQIKHDVYTLDPELILSYINDYNALGPLAKIDLENDTPATAPALNHRNNVAANNEPQQNVTPPPTPASPALTTYGVLTGDNVRVREAPVSGTPIFKLSTGDRVAIFEEKTPAGEKHAWYLIQNQKGRGWIRSDFVKKEQ